MCIRDRQCSVRSIETTFVKKIKDCVAEEHIDYFVTKIGRMNKNLMRISKMIKAVREFSKHTQGEFAEVTVDEMVDSFLSIIEPQIKYEAIMFNKEIEPGMSVLANKIHLDEVLINIMTNAIHAVKYNDQFEKHIELSVKRNGNNTCLIKISDNGYGVNKELIDDIFLDFVTTKASTEGTGMGLPRVRKIIENHGGKVWVESAGEGQGSEFYIEIPLAA